jgi:hypothetical protein
LVQSLSVLPWLRGNSISVTNLPLKKLSKEVKDVDTNALVNKGLIHNPQSIDA